MAQNSPQAVNIPSFKCPGDFLRDIACPAKLDMDQQGLIDGAAFAYIGAGPYLIPRDYNRQLAVRTLHNMSTNPVKYRYVSPRSDDTVKTADFNGVLAGGVAQDDGLGSQLNSDKLDSDISIMCDTGTLRVAITQAYEPGMMLGRNTALPVSIPPAG